MRGLLLPRIIDDQIPCPLCDEGTGRPFFEDSTRCYLRCNWCKLIFVPSQFWLSSRDERAVYDLHENSPDDPGYRRFLSRLTTPLLERLQGRKVGLDFGCGPGPALAAILEEHGHEVVLYDLYYQKNPSALNSSYDFICATEVVEHLREPDQVFFTLFSLLKKGGWLGIMTKLVDDILPFGDWHYIRDMTHICYFHRDTFIYLGKRFNAEPTFIGKDVILFQV